MSDIAYRIQGAQSAGAPFDSADGKIVLLDDDRRIGGGYTGVVYLGHWADSDARDLVVKVPRGESSIAYFGRERDIIRGLRSKVRLRKPPEDAHLPVPPIGVATTHTAEESLALVLPYYANPLLTAIRDMGSSLEAERLAVDAAIELTYAMDGLHDLGYTFMDRKIGDFFVIEVEERSRIVVIDWNVLGEPPTDDLVRKEIIHFADLWHELFLRRISALAFNPLDDNYWQPLTGGSPGGAVSIGFRSILAIAKNPKAIGNWGATREIDSQSTLRSMLLLWQELLSRPVDDPALSVASFTQLLNLPEVVTNAVAADLRWRKAVEAHLNSDEFWLDRETALASAGTRVADPVVDEALRLINSGDTSGAIEMLNHARLSMAGRPAFERQNFERWRMTLEALEPLVTETDDAVFRRICDLLQSVADEMDDDPASSDEMEGLVRARAALDEINQALGNDNLPGLTQKAIEILRAEIQLRQSAVEYRAAPTILEQHEKLQALDGLIGTIPYLVDDSDGDGLLGRISDYYLIRDLLNDISKADYTKLRSRYHHAIAFVGVDVQRRWIRGQLSALLDFIAFMEDYADASSRDLPVLNKRAVELLAQPMFQEQHLGLQILNAVFRASESAYEKIGLAVSAGTREAIRQTYPLYQLLSNDPHRLREVAYSRAHVAEPRETIERFRVVDAFFQKWDAVNTRMHLNTVIGSATADETLFEQAREFVRLIDEAKELKISMTDLIGNDAGALDRWAAGFDRWSNRLQIALEAFEALTPDVSELKAQVAELNRVRAEVAEKVYQVEHDVAQLRLKTEDQNTLYRLETQIKNTSKALDQLNTDVDKLRTSTNQIVSLAQAVDGVRDEHLQTVSGLETVNAKLDYLNDSYLRELERVINWVNAQPTENRDGVKKLVVELIRAQRACPEVVFIPQIAEKWLKSMERLKTVSTQLRDEEIARAGRNEKAKAIAHEQAEQFIQKIVAFQAEGKRKLIAYQKSVGEKQGAK